MFSPAKDQASRDPDKQRQAVLRALTYVHLQMATVCEQIESLQEQIHRLERASISPIRPDEEAA